MSLFYSLILGLLCVLMMSLSMDRHLRDGFREGGKRKEKKFEFTGRGKLKKRVSIEKDPIEIAMEAAQGKTGGGLMQMDVHHDTLSLSFTTTMKKTLQKTKNVKNIQKNVLQASEDIRKNGGDMKGYAQKKAKPVKKDMMDDDEPEEDNVVETYDSEGKGYVMQNIYQHSDCSGSVIHKTGDKLGCQNFFNVNGGPVSRIGVCSDQNDHVTSRYLIYYDHGCKPDNFLAQTTLRKYGECNHGVSTTCGDTSGLFKDSAVNAFYFYSPEQCYEFMDYFFYKGDGKMDAFALTEAEKKKLSERTVPRGDRKGTGRLIPRRDKDAPYYPTNYAKHKAGACGYDADDKSFNRVVCDPDTNEVEIETYSDQGCREYVSKTKKTMVDYYETPVDKCHSPEGKDTVLLYCNMNS